MMFPHPTTGRLLVRRTLSATLGEIGNIFTQEMELFLAEEAKTIGREYDKSNGKKESDNAKAVQRIARRVLNVIVRHILMCSWQRLSLDFSHRVAYKHWSHL